MARGRHIEKRGKRNDDPGMLRQNAHVDVATELNVLLHGERNYNLDISKREISRMIDHVLDFKMATMGPGGYMERQRMSRITRTLRLIFQRTSKLNFNGSKSEWGLWRRDALKEKERLANGGAVSGSSQLQVYRSRKYNRWFS